MYNTVQKYMINKSQPISNYWDSAIFKMKWNVQTLWLYIKLKAATELCFELN